MASENNDISDIVKKCKILLLDIEGTTTSISFVKDKLFPYAEANVKGFLDSQWEKQDVKEVVAELRKLAIEDLEKNTEGVVAIPGEEAGKDEQIEGLVKSVKWQMSADRKVGPLKTLQGLIWKQGYESGDIKGHVYDDVSAGLEHWRSTDGQKVYIYSSGSVQAQKLLFGQSVVGDLLPMIEGHFDTAVGAKQEPASYVTIAEKVGCKPEEILFLSDVVKEVEAARASGLQVALVSREGNAPLPAEATASYPVLHSFAQLSATNKRKPDPQEQELPAKVPKTDIEADVKTVSGMEATESGPIIAPATELVSSNTTATAEVAIAAETVSKAAEEPEKMEVEDDDVPVADNIPQHNEKMAEKAEETAVHVETTVEEVTDSNGAGDAPVCDIEPIVEESIEKTEKNETEQMETESTEIVETDETAIKPKEPVKENIDEKTAPVAKETTTNIVTVQDITNDNQDISEAAEIIDDLVPVVEEPSPVEMEDLQNVGEVLEKECDEILSKVQDVTNLDNIPVKPMLNSITEETMESENGENTNDIVDSILDTEMEQELAAKPCADIDINTVQEIQDKEAEVTENIVTNVEQASVTLDEKPSENIPDKVTENVEGNKDVEIVDNKNVIEEKSDEHTTEMVTEEIQNHATTEDVVTTEVTNGEVQESKPNVVQEKLDTAEKTNATSEAVDNKTDSKESSIPEEKMESGGSLAETVDNKQKTTDTIAESEKCKAVSQENIVEVVETKESVAEPGEKEDETKESSMVPADSQMETEAIATTPVEKQNESDTVEPAENNAETKESNAVQVHNKMESDDSTDKPEDKKMESEESTPQESKAENKSAESELPVPESKLEETKTDNKEAPKPVAEAVTESKQNVPEDVQMESEPAENQINGKTSCESKVNQNGDASKDEELNARLSVENGGNSKEVNGANGNGDSAGIDKDQGDNKVEKEIPDIKVKTVASEEPRTDPIEQPTEA